MTLSTYLEHPPQAVHYVLLGNPVSHSVSPDIHNASLNEAQLPGSYIAVQVLPEEVERLHDLLSNPSLQGVNVTIPYKETIISFVDDIDSDAREIGAVNTLYRQGDQWIGTNTDILGIISSLEKWREQITGSTAMIFGTGGASKGAILALKRLGVDRVFLVTRDSSKKERFSVFSNVNVITYAQWPDAAEECFLFVNATPLGMWPACAESPISKEEAYLLADKLCFDMVYRPLKTLFLQRAEVAGATCVDGLLMLLHQANASFLKWTSHSFSIEKRREEFFEKVNPVLETLNLQMGSSVSAVFTLRNPHLLKSGDFCGLDYGLRTNTNDSVKEFSWNTLHGQYPWISERAWLQQVHGGNVVTVNSAGFAGEGDALVTRTSDLALTIQVADCIPVLFADEKHHVIGAAHAGWRGVVAQIVPHTLDAMMQMGAVADSIQVWIGPGISVRHFEVGEEVAVQFSSERVDHSKPKPHVDLAAVVRDQLLDAGIQPEHIQQSDGCTFADSDLFHSFRRDKEDSGRMVAMIALRI